MRSDRNIFPPPASCVHGDNLNSRNRWTFKYDRGRAEKSSPHLYEDGDEGTGVGTGVPGGNRVTVLPHIFIRQGFFFLKTSHISDVKGKFSSSTGKS